MRWLPCAGTNQSAFTSFGLAVELGFLDGTEGDSMVRILKLKTDVVYSPVGYTSFQVKGSKRTCGPSPLHGFMFSSMKKAWPACLSGPDAWDTFPTQPATRYCHAWVIGSLGTTETCAHTVD